jgi:hypothetical protein
VSRHAADRFSDIHHRGDPKTMVIDWTTDEFLVGPEFGKVMCEPLLTENEYDINLVQSRHCKSSEIKTDWNVRKALQRMQAQFQNTA